MCTHQFRTASHSIGNLGAWWLIRILDLKLHLNHPQFLRPLQLLNLDKIGEKKYALAIIYE